jgi:hypothetical protein
MLPIFPKAKKAMDDAFLHSVRQSIWNASPILLQIPTSPQLEGETASYERVSGEVKEVEYKTMLVERTMKMEYAKGLSPIEFWEAARDIGEQMARQMTENVLSELSAAVEEVGNVTTSSGKGISFEAFLDMNSKMELEFDPEGQPVERIMLASADTNEAFGRSLRAWHADPEKLRAIEKVILKKKMEYHERETRRRMVD